jgi:hypothetical protein
VAPTNAGTYVVRAHFLATTNYNAGQAGANFTISKASSSTVVTCPGSVEYSGFGAVAVLGVGDR